MVSNIVVAVEAEINVLERRLGKLREIRRLAVELDGARLPAAAAPIMSEQRSRRDSMFAMSDITNAAVDFVEALSEYAPILWEVEHKEALTESLVDRAFAVIQSGAEVDFS